MQPVDLNLASRPFKNETLPWLGLILAVGGLGCVTWLNLETWQEHRELLAGFQESRASLRGRLEEFDRRSREAMRGIDGYDLPALALKSEKANEVIRWKSFSWTRLFNQLQEVLPNDVQMSSVNPVFRDDRRRAQDSIEDLEKVPVMVEGTARTLEDFMNLERNLIADPHFSQLEPANWATDENSNETIFRLRFLYDPRVSSDLSEPQGAELASGPNPTLGAPAATSGPDATGIAALGAASASAMAQGASQPPEVGGALAASGLTKIDRQGGPRNKPSAGQAAHGSAPTEAAPTVEPGAGAVVETTLRTPAPPWGIPPGAPEILNDPDEDGRD